jgi:hypothetical protein
MVSWQYEHLASVPYYIIYAAIFDVYGNQITPTISFLSNYLTKNVFTSILIPILLYHKIFINKVTILNNASDMLLTYCTDSGINGILIKNFA